MEKDSLEREYLKSRFRCPICGTLVGCSEEGKVGMFGTKAFRRHVQNCRKNPGVKNDKSRYDNEN